jgi:hypothetical protein
MYQGAALLRANILLIFEKQAEVLVVVLTSSKDKKCDSRPAAGTFTASTTGLGKEDRGELAAAFYARRSSGIARNGKSLAG